MRNGPESSSGAPVRRTRRGPIFIAGLLLLLGVITVAVTTALAEQEEPPTVVIRIDDIQDYAFKDAQLFLLDESARSGAPVSLAVIAGMFGEDRELVQHVKASLNSGSEVAVHGWRHEDLGKLSFGDQVKLLSQSRNRIREILDVDTSILVPPMFSFDEDTVAAMRQEGYNVISTLADNAQPGSLPGGVIGLPATVELSDYANGTWKMKSLDSILAEVSRSVRSYGYAVVVTHPQEFTADLQLNQRNVELYRDLLKTLRESYRFGTLENIGKRCPPESKG
jgi:peptidoglycan/xylan/chitin deacetylase (PgdA/CDA1 family)